MLSRVNTVAFNGLEILPVDLQVQISSGLPAFTVVGLPDKVIAESRERVRAALLSLGLSLPAKRITINLSPADILKEGSHFSAVLLPKKRFGVSTKVYFPGGSGEGIVDALGSRLPMEEVKLDFLDKIVNFLRI